MFLALACLAPLVVRAPAAAGATRRSPALFILNLWYPYAYFNSQWHVEDFHFQPWFDWIFGGFATDTWQKKLWSLAVVAIALVARVARRALGRARRLRGAPARDARAVAAPAAPAPRRPRRRDDASRPAADERRRAGAPLALVALACVFGLVVLRARDDVRAEPQRQRLPPADGALGRRADRRGPRAARRLVPVPLARLVVLPPLPEPPAHAHGVRGARRPARATRRTYLWILYLLLALWPISVYLGARLLGWDRWTAAAAAAVSPLIVSASGYGYEHGSYTWQGYGVYSQLWAMWLLPLAWGLTWRAVARGKHYAAAAAALALTIACHFITGYLALLTVGVWVLVLGRLGLPAPGRPRGARRRSARCSSRRGCSCR